MNIRFLFLAIMAFQLSLSPLVYGQQKFGKEIVAKLTSDEFHGRGYTNNGNKIAADYLAEQFEKYGLKKFNDSYFQKFNIDINTFPKKCGVTIKGKVLQPGVDFLPSPASGSDKGTFKLTWINKDNFLTISRKIEIEKIPVEAIVLDMQGIKSQDTLQYFHQFKNYFSNQFPVVWIQDAKFTHSMSQTQQKHAVVLVSREFVEGAETIDLDIEAVLEKDYETQNVIGFIPGKKKNKYLCVTGHYDHLGEIADTVIFPGANDNASGVAMLIYLMKYYSENPPKYSIVFMAFSAEEVGILGSKYYVENPIFPLEKIKFLVNCDISGTGDEGITVVNGTIHKKQFKKLTAINTKNNYLHKVNIRGRAANSDHFWFTQQQVPCIFIYTMGGIKAYHDIYDKGETLPLSAFTNYSKLLIGFLDSF
ncbi:MAG: aminopeptidase YwaD [Parvicellaceae bacterium]|jgi:aminopeptidase YwaD